MDISNQYNASTMEIVHCIEKAGLDPNRYDLTQLYQAMKDIIRQETEDMIEEAVSEKTKSVGYSLCEFYYFRNPALRPGFQPAQGGLLENAATLYPEAWAYLQTAEGEKLCKTEAEWQAMTKDTWATLADGTKIGWNGIGGAPFYAPNFATGALRLPDLRGMYAEAAGFDSLGVGGAHGDAIRNITGSVGDTTAAHQFFSGALTGCGDSSWLTGPTMTTCISGFTFDASLAVPTGNTNRPRAFGALACVYLGAPK